MTTDIKGARDAIFGFMFGKAQDMGTLSGDDAKQYASDDTDAIFEALNAAGFEVKRAELCGTTTVTNELVKRLRNVFLVDSPWLRKLLNEAALALEALAGEVERAQKDQRHSSAEWYKCIQLKEAAEAERDRLKAALERLGTHTNLSAGERLMIVQEALGDAS
jgi:ribosomal protein L9